MTEDGGKFGKWEKIIIPDDAQPGMRIDRFLTKAFPEFSRSFFQRLIKNGSVLYDGEACNCSDAIRHGSVLEVDMAPSALQELAPQDIALDILYEDEYLIVLNKQAGIVVHPGNGNQDGTLVNAMLHHCDSEEFEEMVDDERRPGIVHRLDKDTSGALIIAKTAEVRDKLQEAFSSRTVKKTYLALLIGEMQESQGTISLPMGRHPYNPLKNTVLSTGGREAITEYKTVGSAIGNHNVKVSLVKIRLHTGRTHQIRVHFSHFGHPVLGDQLYGGQPSRMPYPAERQLLHAWRIAFKHPVTGKAMKIQAPLPEDFMDAITTLGLPIPPQQTTD